MDKASPLLFQALATNSSLQKVTLKFYTQDARGLEINHYTITLSNVRISAITTVLPDARNPAFSAYTEYEEIAFTYETIQWTWTQGGITATDSWATIGQ